MSGCSDLVYRTLASVRRVRRPSVRDPLASVAPQLEREKKRVIRDNYLQLKKIFDADSLFNWADVNPSDLAEELHTIEPEINRDEWEETSITIIEGIEECSNATKIQPDASLT